MTPVNVPAPPGPCTCTGLVLNVDAVLPVPSWPCVLSPQAHTVPSVLTATLDSWAAATDTTPVRVPVPPGPTTCAGVSFPATDVVLSPSSPSVFCPHDQTVPSDATARLWATGVPKTPPDVTPPPEAKATTRGR